MYLRRRCDRCVRSGSCFFIYHSIIHNNIVHHSHLWLWCYCCCCCCFYATCWRNEQLANGYFYWVADSTIFGVCTICTLISKIFAMTEFVKWHITCYKWHKSEVWLGKWCVSWPKWHKSVVWLGKWCDRRPKWQYLTVHLVEWQNKNFKWRWWLAKWCTTRISDKYHLTSENDT